MAKKIKNFDVKGYIEREHPVLFRKGMGTTLVMQRLYDLYTNEDLIDFWRGMILQLKITCVEDIVSHTKRVLEFDVRTMFTEEELNEEIWPGYLRLKRILERVE